MTSYTDFLKRIIDDGVAAVHIDYKNSAEKRDGAVAGFEACRGKDPSELAVLLGEANLERQRAFHEQRSNYWYYVCYHAEIEWTCNVVSSALWNQGLPLIITPTTRGYMKAAEILGVAGSVELPSEHYRSPS